MRAQGPLAIQRLLTGLLVKVPDFRFENVRIWIDTPDRVFGEYDGQGHVVATGNSTSRPTRVCSSPSRKIKLLREALDTLAASRAFSTDGV